MSHLIVNHSITVTSTSSHSALSLSYPLSAIAAALDDLMSIEPAANLQQQLQQRRSCPAVFLPRTTQVRPCIITQLKTSCTRDYLPNQELIPYRYSSRCSSCCCFLQRVNIACYAERCISHSKSVRPSVCPSVRLSVCHTLALSQNDSSYDHGVFTGDSPMTLVSSTLNLTAKFQREHGERGRRMREG